MLLEFPFSALARHFLLQPSFRFADSIAEKDVLFLVLTSSLLIRDMRVLVERKRDGTTGELFDQFGGMMFKDGYLYKYVSLKTIDAKGIEPSLDELQKFQKPGEDGMDALGLPPSAVKNRAQFMKGDAVVVIEGDLRNIMGVVEKVDDDNVYITPKYKDLTVGLLTLLCLISQSSSAL